MVDAKVPIRPDNALIVKPSLLKTLLKNSRTFSIFSLTSVTNISFDLKTNPRKVTSRWAEVYIRSFYIRSVFKLRISLLTSSDFEWKKINEINSPFLCSVYLITPLPIILLIFPITFCDFWPLPEKCPNTKFLLVRIFLYSDRIWRFTP